MKLTDRILLSSLKKQFQIKDTSRIGTSGQVGGPLLYEKGEIPEEGWVYVADSVEEVPVEKMQKGSFWVFLKGDYLPHRCTGVLLEEGESLGVVLNFIRKTFVRYERWEENLRKIVDEQGSVQELLQVSLPMFGNPLTVIGADFSVHSVASNTPLPPEYQIFGQGKEKMDLINAFMQDQMFVEGSKSDKPFWIPEYLTGQRAVSINLWKDNRISYRIVVTQYRNILGGEHEDMLEILRPHVTYLLYFNQAEDYHRGEDLSRVFRQILSNRTLDYVEASQKLTGFGWLKQHEYLCLVYKITYLDQKHYSANAICNHMEERYPGCCSFTYNEDVVTFFDLTLVGRDAEEVEEELKPFIRDGILKAGYSRMMKGHMNLRRQYIQACLALEVGSRKRPYMWIHHFNQIAMTYILEQITRKLPGSMLCHEGLLLLKETDEQNGTEYMKTLRTYLDFHQNAVQTAKELYIHRSTFLYRLEKIKSILESDLDDTEELLYLELSFRLLEQEERGL